MRILSTIGLMFALSACGGGSSINETSSPGDTVVDFSMRTYLVNAVSGEAFPGAAGSLSLTYTAPTADETTLAANVSLGQFRVTDLLSWRDTDPSNVLFTLRDGFDNGAEVTNVNRSIGQGEYDFYLVGSGQVGNTTAAPPSLQVLERLETGDEVRIRLLHSVVSAAETQVDFYDVDSQALVAADVALGDVTPAYDLAPGQISFGFIVTETGVSPDFANLSNNLWFARVNNLQPGGHLVYLYDIAADWAQLGSFYEELLNGI